MARCGTWASALLLCLCSVLSLVAGGCQEAGRPPEKVTVQLGSRHDAEFAGFYVAEQNGFYAAEGLDVTLLLRSTPAADPIAPVAAGTVDFGLGSGPALVEARSRGLPVVAVAAIVRVWPQVFMTLAETGIGRAQDFPGHTVRTLDQWSAVIFRAMMLRLGLDPAAVRQIDAGYGFPSLYAGEIDIWSTQVYDGVLEAREKGASVNLIFPQDHGIRLYGECLLVSDRTRRENPDLVQHFLRATLRGWRWAVENAKEAGRLALEYDPKLDADHLVAQMEASLPLVHTGEDQVGWMRRAIWQTTHDILRDQGLLTEPVDIDSVYTMEFLHEVYGGPEQ